MKYARVGTQPVALIGGRPYTTRRAALLALDYAREYARAAERMDQPAMQHALYALAQVRRALRRLEGITL